jgi:hypothetical protein
MDNVNCRWCGGNTRKCMSKNDVKDNCPMPAMTCEDTCKRIPTCSSCNAASGCGWCKGTDGGADRCLDVDKSTCPTLWAHACAPTPVVPEKKCGFNGGSFVGGMFLVIGVIVVGGVAYLFYRWKTGRKILYTELR